VSCWAEANEPRQRKKAIKRECFIFYYGFSIIHKLIIYKTNIERQNYPNSPHLGRRRIKLLHITVTPYYKYFVIISNLINYHSYHHIINT
jgi:hypothetical protein